MMYFKQTLSVSEVMGKLASLLTEDPSTSSGPPPAAPPQPRCAADREQFLRPEVRMRRERRDAWFAARRRLDYAQALRDLGWAGCSVFGQDSGFDRDRELLPLVRQAQAALLLTPAPDQAALKWKRQTAKDAAYLPISGEAITAAIAADEAWFRENP